MRRIILAGFLLGMLAAPAVADEQICPDGRRSYFGVCPTGIPTPTPDQDRISRIQQSYLEAFCRLPIQDETRFWLGDPRSANLPALIENHRAFLRTTASERREMIARSYREIFSRDPRPDEMDYWDQQVATTGMTCAELKRNHEQFRRDNPNFR
jgi:hypothetical protein